VSSERIGWGGVWLSGSTERIADSLHGVATFLTDTTAVTDGPFQHPRHRYVRHCQTYARTTVSPETVGVETNVGGRDDEKATKVHQVAAAVADLAGKARREFVQVAVDV